MKNRKAWGIIAKKMELHALQYVPPPCPVSPSECSTIPLGMFCVAELMAPSVPCFNLPAAALFLQWSQRWGGREFSNTSTIRGYRAPGKRQRGRDVKPNHHRTFGVCSLRSSQRFLLSVGIGVCP